jgi:K+-transporting ATPase ATPase C chain
MLKKSITTSLKFLLIITLFTGLVYPLVVTGLARLLFPWKTNGSLVRQNGQLMGSLLIGQEFDSTIYFSGRPSAISYFPLHSGGSNLALTNMKLKEDFMRNRNDFIQHNNPETVAKLPAEMLFASASGLDPHISPYAALLQVDRIASVRGYDSGQKQKLKNLIISLTEPPQFLILGKERINVFLLNLETDKIR